jgi:methionyl-tRNA formyltransferase
MNYVVAAVGDWNKRAFEERLEYISGNWAFVSTPEELNKKLFDGFEPKYIFFPHWRWVVPEDISNKYECVCFHMTDVPYGRGGSPLQNLISRGHKKTVLTALRMEKGLDTGPVYLKKPMILAGKAEDIYIRASRLTWDMIEEIISDEALPKPQEGESIVFKRRTPEQSETPQGLNIDQIYDHIRMLDAPGYPRAFIETESYRLEFENAELDSDEVIATVRLKIKE